LLRGRFDLAARHGASAVEVSQAFGYKLWLDVGRSNSAAAAGRQGLPPGSITALRASIDDRIASGSITILQYYFIQLAELHRIADDPWLALAAIEEAFAYGCGHGELWFLAEHHRVRGELLISQGERAKGEADLREALKTAQSQGARLFQLRAALSLRRHAQGGDGEAQARTLLAEAARQIAAEDGACIGEWREAARLLAPV